MTLLRRLACKLGRHHRLGRTVQWDGMDYRSVCRFCGVPMVKHGNVRWRAVAQRSDTLLLTYHADEVPPWPTEAPTPPVALLPAPSARRG